MEQKYTSAEWLSTTRRAKKAIQAGHEKSIELTVFTYRATQGPPLENQLKPRPTTNIPRQMMLKEAQPNKRSVIPRTRMWKNGTLREINNKNYRKFVRYMN